MRHGINRRAFLGLLAAGAAGAALDPDFLKWEPGARRYFDLHRARVLRFQRGDIITLERYFADGTRQPYYAVNPITRQVTPYLQRFMVTADVYDDGGIPAEGSIPIEIYPRSIVREPVTLSTHRLNGFLVGDTVGDAIVRG